MFDPEAAKLNTYEEDGVVTQNTPYDEEPAVVVRQQMPARETPETRVADHANAEQEPEVMPQMPKEKFDVELDGIIEITKENIDHI